MRFYVGSYSVPGSLGIAVCDFDGRQFHVMDQYNELNNPTWVTVSDDKHYLYALGKNASGEQVIAGFSTKGDALSPLSEAQTGGNSSCHLTISPNGGYLIACHYHEGRVSLYPINKGIVGAQLQVLQHTGTGPVAERQQGPHAHQSMFRPDTQEVFVCDLGSDTIFVYRLSERLQPLMEIPVPAGSGPRHMVFDGQDRFYVCGELSSQVLCYQLNDTGTWVLSQAVSTLPEPWAGNTCAAIRLHRRQLSVSNRGHDSIALFDLDDLGHMTPAGHLSSHGQGPRDFVRLSDGFLVANQLSGGVQYLSPTGVPIASLAYPGAVCIAGTDGL